MTRSVRRLLLARLALAVLLLALGGGAGLAVGRLTARPADPQAHERVITAAVESGELSETLSLTVEATWPARALSKSWAAGVVTSVEIRNGDRIRSGQQLFAVDLEPVTVIAGAIPMFRDITPGVKGPDVSQVQRFLAAEGLYSGPADGIAGRGTAMAVRAWQSRLGLNQTGVLQRRDLIVVPTLPLTVQVDPRVLTVGKELSGGEVLVRAFAPEPEFSIRTTKAVEARLTPQTPITVDAGAASWAARVRSSSPDVDSGQVVLRLAGERGAVCADACDLVPRSGVVRYPAGAELQRPVRGSLVPSAAILTDADSRTLVVLADGSRRPVRILATVAGRSCVTGVSAGQRVRVPGTLAG
ncbi:MAG: peptidoglycan-binding domain-containing protein [Tetrasphaera sp.]